MDVIALIILVAVFLLATIRPVNMGALALVAAFVVSIGVYRLGDDALDTVLGGFPGGLFVILVGVTYLFAIAKNNGTVDWLVQAAVWAVRGKIKLIPWAMFVVAALITSIGAATPAAVAIIAPVALGFAARYRIAPALMGFMVIQGATAGSFSPLGVFGIITSGVIRGSDLPFSSGALFGLSLLACTVLCVLAYFTMARGQRRELAAAGAVADRDDVGASLSQQALAASSAATRGPVTGTPTSLVERGEDARRSGGRRAGTGDVAGDATTTEFGLPRLDAQRALTLVLLVALVLAALVLGLDVGFLAISAGVLLTLVFPASAKGAVDKVAWGTVLLITGIVTYVSLLEGQGTVTFLGDEVAAIGAPLIAALVICVIGGLVSAFASTTGILGTLIPLSLPFLATGQVSAIGLVVALGISSSVVDCSPFSTNGALVVANSSDEDRNSTFRTLMVWGMTLIVAAPLVTWGLLVVPGWL